MSRCGISLPAPAGSPTWCPPAFKDVTPEGRLVVGDVFLDTTLKDLTTNKKVL
ncbi:hypothetical protein [Pseudoflavonifractor sp. MSJ-37]|uniref:hypothetical protein n=1 Tax=Pseudoflavonifractor sp. MSJ-37 TaxID=2841531 RepID=UPI001C10815F|nr:hypothetical protein [Pseudoflavonifractor sp. MSJ-37]MBU5435000.1 hypothetical protein [Pseudoflavonifractor sp. MSJ-37]